MGARAYRCLSLYEPDPGLLVEVGSERGEGSTLWLADYADRHGLTFRTADIDHAIYAHAFMLTPGARNCTGIELLRRARRPISVAYLDGFDWVPSDLAEEEWVADQRQHYADLGIEQTNEAAEREQLTEAVLVAARAAQRSVVICDDTFWQENRWHGKGALAVPYLLGQGFDCVDHFPREASSLGAVVLRRSR